MVYSKKNPNRLASHRNDFPKLVYTHIFKWIFKPKKKQTAQEHFLPIPLNWYFNFCNMFRNVHTMVATAQLILRIAWTILSFNVYAYISWSFRQSIDEDEEVSHCHFIHSYMMLAWHGMECEERNKNKRAANWVRHRLPRNTEYGSAYHFHLQNLLPSFDFTHQISRNTYI